MAAKLFNAPTVIFILFIFSAVCRIAIFAPTAYAQIAQDMESTDVDEQNLPTIGATNEQVLGELLEELNQRERSLTQREDQYIAKKKALEIVEQSVNKRIDDLNAAEEKLRETIALANTAAENDLERLTQVYERMKPVDAAQLFAKMEPNFAAGFLGLMNVDVAAQIMSNLEPDFAFAVSAILAGRNVGVPTFNDQ